LPEYTAGDFIFNTNGWQEYGLTGEGISVFNYMFPRKLDPSIAPISTAVGVLGMLGLTAYSGLVVQCQPHAGETVVVSAASGGVGQVVGQIAKIAGCRVVGIAGVQAKCDFVTETLGFDACVSHLSEHLPAELNAACPDGVDIYFENVGGKVFDAVLPLLNHQSRISLCGLISQYSNDSIETMHDAWMAQGRATFTRQQVQAHRLTVGNFVKDYQDQFLAEMGAWVHDGLIKYKEDLWPGLEQAPKAFRAMMEGRNFGKTLVGVGDDPTLDASLTARRASTNIFA
jgi:NADPH-dependent curcumin reductase CurA